MTRSSAEKALRRELKETRALSDWVRGQLYCVRAGAWREAATTAVAAAAAEETYRLADGVPQWQNEVSEVWREHLQQVWALLEGDTSRHYVLSEAVADYLRSPLNHIEGQDEPDDFDRPQTISSYSAVLSSIAWGVDFGVTAVEQIFDFIDLIHDGEFPEPRWEQVRSEVGLARRLVAQVVESMQSGESRLHMEVLNAIRAP